MDSWGAALIGAVVGSIGGQLVANWYDRKKTINSNRRLIVSRYLVQLQDATESLAARARNVARHGGLKAMDNDYYRLTTLFALAQFLGHKRRLVVDGVYSQILEFRPDLAPMLKSKLEAVETVLGRHRPSGRELQRYDRLALAEAALVRTDSGIYACSYSEFVGRWQSDTGVRSRLAKALDFVEEFDHALSEALLSPLDEVGQLLGSGTDLTYTYKGLTIPKGATRD